MADSVEVLTMTERLDAKDKASQAKEAETLANYDSTCKEYRPQHM